MSITNLLKDSFSSFRDRWGEAVLVTLIFLAITFIVGLFAGSVSLIFLAISGLDLGIVPAEILNQLVSQTISVIVSAPLTVGLLYFSFNVSRDSNPELGDILFGFRQKWGLSIGIYLVVIIAFLLLGTIAGIIGFGIYSLFQGNIVLIIFGILLLISYTILSLMFSQVYLIITDNNDIGVIDAFSMSMKMMQGYKTKLFSLQLLLGFMIFTITLITCGFGLLVLIPYMYIVQCKFHDYIKDNPISVG